MEDETQNVQSPEPSGETTTEQTTTENEAATQAAPVQGGLGRYKCHKEVLAAKIARVDAVVGSEKGWSISFEDASILPVVVDDAYIDKHAPKVGGYYVRYEDGYASFSPAEAFENGYTRID